MKTVVNTFDCEKCWWSEIGCQCEKNCAADEGLQYCKVHSSSDCTAFCSPKDNCGVEPMVFNPNDPANNDYAVITITPGNNGGDAVDFVDMLHGMYLNWSLRHGFRAVHDVAYSTNNVIALKIYGKNVFRLLMSEDGVHRLTRNSTHAGMKWRRCTIYAAVNVTHGMDHPAVNWENCIRNYVLDPYKLVKDLRTGYETEDANGVLHGGTGTLDQFITAYENMKAMCPDLPAKNPETKDKTAEEDKKMKTISDWSGEYSWLRNDSDSYVSYEGLEFPTVEHAYQASKSNDFDIRNDMVGHTIREVRRLGRSLPLSPNWAGKKLQIMEVLLRQKFSSESGFGELLLDTGDAILEMHTKNDPFWGVTPSGGENHMGKILTKIRDELRMQCGDSLSSVEEVDESVAVLEDAEDRINTILDPLDSYLAKLHYGEDATIDELEDIVRLCSEELSDYAHELGMANPQESVIDFNDSAD